MNRQFLGVFFVLTAFGFVSVLSMLNRPTLMNVSRPDGAHLVGTGMCFGGAIICLAVYFRGRR